MKHSFFILIFFYYSNFTLAQFTNLNPVLNGNDLWSSFFINDQMGWFIGSDGIIIKTTDAGTTWNSQNSNVNVTLKSIKFTDNNVGYICGEGGTILKTSDGGNNWINLFSGVNTDLNSLYFINWQKGYAAGKNGVILKTTDAGISWVSTYLDSTFNLKSLFFVDDSVGYTVGIDAKILKTTDGGNSWIDKSPNLEPELFKFNTVYFINRDTGFIGAGKNYEFESPGVILQTTDGGNSWTQKTYSVSNKSIISHKEINNYDDSYGIRQIFFLDNLKGFAVAGTGFGWARTILTTSNGGVTWIYKYATLEEYGLLTVIVTNSGIGFAGGFNGSIFNTSDGGNTWRQSFSGGVKYGGEEQIKDIVFINDSVGFAGGFRGSFDMPGEVILKTSNGGKTWITSKYTYSSYNQINSIFFLNESKGWAGSEEQLLSTTDGGNSWQILSSGIYEIKDVFFNDSLLGFLVTDNFVYKSTDGGNTWVQKSSEGGNSIFFADNNTGWVVGNNGSIRKTTDGGETWLVKNSGTNANINSVKFFNVNLGTVCGNNGVILITTDGGETWQNRATGLIDNLQSLVFKDENTLWCVGNSGKILESNNLGVSWVYHNNVTSKNLSTIALNPDGNLFIGGSSGALFRYSDNITPTPPHFNKIWTGNPFLPMNIYITSASLDNIPLNSRDEIAVFSGQYCVGTVKLNDSIPTGGFISLIASADDPTTSLIDGFISGDTILFKVWDLETQTETEYVDAVFIQGDGRYALQGTCVVELNANEVIYQTISLLGGWNIISLYSEPLNKNMLSIFDTLIDSEVLVKVQDETGNALEKLPPPIGWINNIGNWLPTEGYYTKIQNNSSATLISTGFKIDLPLNVSLNEGWNIISYPFNSEQNAVSILQDLISADHLIKVQDEQGNAIEYLPPPIGWINNIGNFKPGEGYYIKVNANTSLLYQQQVLKNKDAKKFKFAERNKTLHFVPDWQGNPYMPMNIYVSGFNLPDNITLNSGDEIGIYDNELCVGAVQITDNDLLNGFVQIIVSSDDPTTDQTDGFISGNPVSLRVWLSGNNQTINISSPQFITGTGNFEALGTAVIGFDNIIPVELISFNAEVSSKTVILSWQTASEINNSGFEIQRAYSDSKENRKNKELKWEIIGFVEGKGNSSEINSYSFMDNVKYSYGSILYRLKQIDLNGNYKFSDIVEAEIIPDELILYQNYPNPFNPSTKIRFVIPNGVRNLKDFSSQASRNDNSLVSLKVYDILGNEVATLVDELKAAGSYEVEFDASNLSSGVYIYRLSVSDKGNMNGESSILSEHKKMILMR